VKKSKAAVPLLVLRRGETGRIAHLAPQRPADLQKFLVLGLLPGEPVRILLHQPLHVVQVGHTRVALDREGARSIYLYPD